MENSTAVFVSSNRDLNDSVISRLTLTETIPANSSTFFPSTLSSAPSDSLLVTEIGISVLFALASAAGIAVNTWLLVSLHRGVLLHQPTHFLIALTALANLSIGFAVPPLAILHINHDHLSSTTTPGILINVINLIMGTALFTDTFLLAVIAVYRLRIAGRECVDDTRLTVCALYGVSAALAAFFLSLQHIFPIPHTPDLREVSQYVCKRRAAQKLFVKTFTNPSHFLWAKQH